MQAQLGLPEWHHVFSFLEAQDLLRATQVDKVARAVPSKRQGAVHGPAVTMLYVPPGLQFPKSGRGSWVALNTYLAEDMCGP